MNQTLKECSKKLKNGSLKKIILNYLQSYFAIIMRNKVVSMNTLSKLLFLILSFSSFLFADVSFTHIHLKDKEQNFLRNHPIINVGVEKDWPPFDFVENGEYKGVARDYLDLIAQKSGLKFNYVIDSWENLLEKSKNGKIDLLPCISKTKAREEFLNFTKPYIKTRDYIFVKDTNKDIKSKEDIKNKTAAVVRGYINAEILTKEYPSVKLYYVKDTLEAIDAIITNKADFMVENIALLNYLTSKYSISNISAKFHFNYEWNEQYMATRKDLSILKDILERSLDSVTEEEKNIITKKWIEGKALIEASKGIIDLTIAEKVYLENKKTITIANEFNWFPFDYNEQGEAKGYSIDYIKLVLSRLDLKPIFVTDEWPKLMEKFKKGEIDILPVISYSKKREEFLKFTQSYFIQHFSIVTRTSTTNIINNDDLKNKKVGMVKTWNSTTKLRENHPEVNVIEFETLEDVFDALKNNFIDATIQNTILSSYYINKDYYGDLKIISDFKIKGLKNSLYMGISKNEHTLHNLFEKAIDSITKEEKKALNDKWINITNEIEFTQKENNFIEKETIRVGTLNKWAPISFINNDNKLDGIGVDYFKEVMNKANLKVKFHTFDNFEELLNKLKAKEIDIIFSTSKTKDREDFSIFSNTYLKAPIGIATLQDENYISNINKIIDKKIAVGKNYTAHKLLEEKYPNIDFLFVKNAKEGLEQVSNSNAYAYVDIMPVLSYQIKTNAFTNIKISGQTGLEFEVSFMMRDDYKILQNIVNKVLNKISHEKKDSIYNKWLDTKFVNKTDYSLLWKIILFFIIVLFFIIYKNRQLVQYQKKLKLANEKSENSVRNFKKVIDLNIAGILIIRDKKIKELNSETLKILGYSTKSELIGNDISKVFKAEDIENLCSHLSTIQSYEISAISKKNSEIPVLLKGQTIDFDNKPSHLISIVNLTELKNKEEIMLQQSKMASLGEMIGNIAHQWRQPLSSISTAASGLRLQKEFDQLTDETFYDSLDKITETTQFLSQTIDDFKNYIKDNKVRKEFNIARSIEKVLSIMKASFVNGFITVEKNLENVIIDNFENELNQVLLNILSNSKDALKNIKEDERYINIKAYKKEENIFIEIVDNGGGIEKEILSKVFEPYFTTKHQSQGTGLGLYMTHNILTDSIGGNITIENCSFNDYEKCTKVTIIIPI